jgi:hypothetical protein
MVAVVTAVQRPDLVERLACISGPFHLDGWIPEAIDPANAPPDFCATGYGEVSTDGIGHFPVVADKMARAHLEGPTLTAADLARVSSATGRSGERSRPGPACRRGSRSR